MNFSTFVSNKHELSVAREYGVNEVLLADKMLSRTGRLNAENVLELASEAKQLGLKTVLVWDALATEFDFADHCRYFESLDLSHIDAVRAQDAGVWHYLLSKNTKMQMVLESGNHNLVGIKSYIDFFRPILDKVVLSIELPEKKIKQYCEQLDVPVEILGLGPILLFYTPRKLLTADHAREGRVQNHSEEFIQALAESEESPHKGFPVIETRHGTFMFHIKNFMIVEYFQTLFSAGLHSMRLDLTDVGLDFLPILRRFIQGEITAAELKELYPKDTIRGFYHTNKSDVLFNKLKNWRIQRKDQDYLAEVADVIRDRFIVLEVKNPGLNTGMAIKYITPEGKELESQIERLLDLNQNPIAQATVGSFVLINHRRGIWPKSQVYLLNKAEV